MVKIDETYFDDNLEEELQVTPPVATDELDADAPSEPKPLLADLLESEENEESDETESEVYDKDEEVVEEGYDEVQYEEPKVPQHETYNHPDRSDDVDDSETFVPSDDSDDSDHSEDEKEDDQSPRRSAHGLWYWLGGDVLAQPTFRRYIPAFIAILLMGLIHVTSNYQIIAKRRQIDKLETRVKDLTYKHMESVSELTRRSIGGNFEQQLHAMGSDLEAPSQQSIILYRDAEKKK